ncbi:transcriptional regulator [Bacillus phage vB_BceH_LY2]|nr:transcriptional regulator [Bacillus phage vB_BceH_LY2]
MSKYNADTEIMFSISTGYVGYSREETFTLGGLGYDLEYDGTSEEEIEYFIQGAYEEWELSNLDSGW